MTTIRSTPVDLEILGSDIKLRVIYFPTNVDQPLKGVLILLYFHAMSGDHLFRDESLQFVGLKFVAVPRKILRVRRAR
jgi:hypothetical protein